MADNASRRDQARLFAAIEGIAVSLWLAPASVHIVRWESAGPLRLALLQPTWQLLVLLALGIVAFGALYVTGRAGRASRVLAPALVLWTFTLPYLPWLADRLPLLLMLAGPIRWVLAALVKELRPAGGPSAG